MPINQSIQRCGHTEGGEHPATHVGEVGARSGGLLSSGRQSVDSGILDFSMAWKHMAANIKCNVSMALRAHSIMVANTKDHSN